MELYVMSYVIAAADQGNFSMAAQVCHVGQPALSQQISKLEKELGTPLFYRIPRGVALTEAGEKFVSRAREILQLADSLQEEMALYAGLQKGTITIGIITSLQCIDFGGMLSAFCHKYPKISVNIVQGGTYRLIELLRERKLNAAFINRPVSGLPPHLAFAKLGSDCYSLAVPDGHPLAVCGYRISAYPQTAPNVHSAASAVCPDKHRAVSLTELKGERFIFHQNNQAASELCLNACREAGFEPEIVCRSGSPTTGLYMVLGGLGVAFLPSEEFTSHSMEGIIELRLKEKIVKEVGIVWRNDSVSPILHTLVNFSKEWVARGDREMTG